MVTSAQQAALETDAGRQILLSLLSGDYVVNEGLASARAELCTNATMRNVAFALMAGSPAPVEYRALRAEVPHAGDGILAALRRLLALRLIWISPAVWDLRATRFGLTKLGQEMVPEVLFRSLLADLGEEPANSGREMP